MGFLETIKNFFLNLFERVVIAFELIWSFLKETFIKISPSLDIFWKGMLAIFLALGIIMVVTMLLNFVINKAQQIKKEDEYRKANKK